MFFRKKKRIEELEREVRIVREEFERDRDAKIEFITMFKLDDKENTVLPRGFKIEIR